MATTGSLQPLLSYSAAGLSLLATVAGGTGLVQPDMSIEAFGLRPVTDPQGRELARALCQAYGVRNMSMGIVNLAIWYLGRQATGPAKTAWRQALGVMFIAGAATPIVDGILTERQGQQSGWRHWVFAPVSLLLGLGLYNLL